MAEEAAGTKGPELTEINAPRLFLASCMALISTAVGFAVITASLFSLKTAFNLTNEGVGMIVGAYQWGCPVSLLILGPLCDALGMKLLLRIALVCHLVGPLLMIFAAGDAAFWMLFSGALILGVGAGPVHAACNPLVTTVYSDRKTEKLAHFHLWWPGGIAIGGVLSFLLDSIHLPFWQLKLSLILVPTVCFGILFIAQKFPVTERVQSGVSFGGMFKETFLRPLCLLLLLCMMITASVELGPNTWIPSVLQAGGIPGILVLVYISGLMVVLRSFARTVSRTLSNASILLISSVLAGIGLTMLSYSTSIWFAFISATIFGVGVCYFWPTMIGTTAERVPKGGSLALAVMGAAGMLTVGLITSPRMGRIADDYLHRDLVTSAEVAGKTVDRQQETAAALEDVLATYSAIAKAPPKGVVQKDFDEALATIKLTVAAWKADKELPRNKVYPAGRTLPDGATAPRDTVVDTATALRVARGNGPADVDEESESGRAALAKRSAADIAAAKAKMAAAKILGRANNRGGLISFRYVAPFSIVLVLVFGALCLYDRRAARGTEEITEPVAAGEAAEGTE